MIQVWFGRGLVYKIHAFTQGGDAIELVGAEDGIDFRDIFPDLIAIALHQATGDNEPLRAAGLLVFGHFKDRIDGFLFGRINEAASIDDDHVRFGRLGSELMAFGD